MLSDLLMAGASEDQLELQIIHPSLVSIGNQRTL